MAIIYSYPEIGSVHNDDLFIISRTSSDNKTFSLKATELSSYILDNFSIGIAGDTGTGTIANAQTLSVLGTAGQIQTTASGQDITLSIDPSFLPAEGVTGTGTTNTLPIWSNGPGSVLGDSGVSETRSAGGSISNIIIATDQAQNPLNVSFGTGGATSFKQGTTEFIKLTDDPNGFYTSSFRYGGKLTVDRDSASNNPSLDVGDNNHVYPAAWFRNGVVISNNPSGIQVDNTSMVIGSGDNDIVSGSDHCLAVGKNNQITSNSDQSVAFGQGNTITSSADAFAVGNSNTITSSQRTLVLGYQNNVDSASSFIAGGDNTVPSGTTKIVLGYNNVSSGNNNFAMGNETTTSTGEMVLGYRNNPAEYPSTDINNGLSEVKFAVATGANNTTNSNALLITAGGKNGGNPAVPQIPRIILPQQETLEFTSDADATAGGIPTGGLYRSGNDLKINFNDTAAGGNEGLAYLTPQLIAGSGPNPGPFEANVDPNYNLVLLSWNGPNGVFTLNLPLASANTHRLIRITTDGSLNSGAADKIDITATGGETIDGAASFQISKRYEGLAIYSTGSEWIIVQAKAH